MKLWNIPMKLLLILFAFFLPLHALFVTILKCKLWANTDIIRFWKEFIVIFLLFIWTYSILKRYHFKIWKIFQGNYILWFSVAFIFSSLLYIFFPFFSVGINNLLGFKYDVFFIFTLIAGFSLISIRNSIDTILKSVFASTWLILIIFLPWYIFGDIALVSDFFGYSDKVSTYNANSCISFSQNVSWHHRFQASFGWPIRFSVFLIVFLFLYIWYILDTVKNHIYRSIFISIPSLFVVTSVFFSYSKTSMLGLMIWAFIFFYFLNKFIFKWKLTSKQKKVLKIVPILIAVSATIIMFIKRGLFLHLWSLINRFDNLALAVKKFLYNPIGSGVWTSGPATQIGPLETDVWWKSSINSIEVYKYLPENWYVQILLEQSFLWLFFFLGLLIFISIALYKIMQKTTTYFSIWLLTAFLSLCFMANFTHAFEEAATSYLLFLIIWAYIWKHYSLTK